MTYDPKFGPAAQTPAQRAWVLAQMQRMLPGLAKKMSACTQQLYARYVAGELTWYQVSQAREAALATGGGPL
ncbi:hypothetical protein [Hymenobacter bucti]|uniref:Antitoxin VbhA domain-containing protein n=1 Tax=Hymenobacter bucti TaxID=1844114 RepID=A0ABW4QNK0_9BACT